MSKNGFMKLFFVLSLFFLFSAPSVAYDFNPSEWIIHDDVNAKEAAEELLSRQEAAKEEEGVYRPFVSVPTYEFGGTQNMGTNNANADLNWPASMRKGMDNNMDSIGNKSGRVEDWFKTPAFFYRGEPNTIPSFVNANNYFLHSRSEDIPGNIGYFTSQKDMIQWFEDIKNLEKAPKRMKYQLITGFPYFTGNGYSDYELARTFELIFAVFSLSDNDEAAFTPEQVKALERPVVWLHASIHGRETSPGEALLQLAKEFANGEHDDILEKVTVIIVPRFNVDGAWNAQRTSTGAARVGHAGQGNAGVDMNRDFVAFETPIVRAVRQLQIAYNPIVSFCGHEQGYTFDTGEFTPGATTGTGHYRGYDVVLSTSMTYNLNVDRRVRDLGYYLYEPATKKVLEESKVGWNRYVGGSVSAAMGHGTFSQTIMPADIVSRDGISGPISGEIRYTTAQTDFALVPEEGIGINGTALGNQSIVFVYEASAVGGNNTCIRLAYLRRVYAQYLGALEIARTAAHNVDIISSAFLRAQEAEIKKTGDKENLYFWGKAPAPVNYVKNVLEYKTWEKEDIPRVVNSIDAGTRPIKWILAHFATPDTDNQRSWVKRPTAYIISPDCYEAALRLFYSGVKLERLSENQTVNVEYYTVATTGSTTSSTNSPSGSTSQMSVEIKSVTKANRQITFPKDSFVVRMNQLGASLAGLALEPMAIRNYGNSYLSRSPSTVIPTEYRDTFFPVALGRDFPCYRYVGSIDGLKTYSAEMNIPMVLTMVEKVLPFDQDDVNGIKKEFGNNPDLYISRFEMPVLARSGDTSYKNKPDVLLNETFMLPSGKIVENLKLSDYADENNIVTLVAPNGLDEGDIYAVKINSNGEVVGKEIIYEKEKEYVSPYVALKEIPQEASVNRINFDGVFIDTLKWNTFEGDKFILRNDMLSGDYKIKGFTYEKGNGYDLSENNGELTVKFDFSEYQILNDVTIEGKAEIKLTDTGKYLLVEFSSKPATGCNAGHYPLFILVALIPFVVVIARKRFNS